MALFYINTLKEAKEAISKNKSVLLMASATYCPPCKMLTPVIEEIAQMFEGKSISFFKVDLDEAREVNGLISVGSVPTLIFFRNGVERHRTIGFSEKDEVLDRINKFLASE